MKVYAIFFDMEEGEFLETIVSTKDRADAICATLNAKKRGKWNPFFNKEFLLDDKEYIT